MIVGRLKRVTRHVVTRTITPHLDAQTAEIDRIVAARLAAAEAAPVGDPVIVDFNHLLHELRTIELRQLPVNGGVLLSAGCAGVWYFDWLEQCAGPFERHIGVELYATKPEGLPPNVTWIAESASRMPAVDDGSVDVVFSGQNLEHLWIDDLAGFLSESRRVLRAGGVLVIDSPNRLAVEGLGWVHPEHTIELTADEAARLLDLAGFDVELVRGLWNCRDRRSRDWMTLEPVAGDVREILDRAVTRRDIDDDFVWWIAARRAEREVDTEAVMEQVVELFRRHWDSRVNRAAECTGEREAAGSWRVSSGVDGVVYRTRPLPLFAGGYRVKASHPQLTVRVIRPDGSEIARGAGTVAGALPATEFGVAIELIAEAPLAEPLVGVGVRVELTPDD